MRPSPRPALLFLSALCLGRAAFSGEKSELLSEMHVRRVLAEKRTQWGPEDYTKLLRVREAQALGAFELLRQRLGTLKGLARERERGPGYERLWLTWEGYEEYIFLKSQDARAYFESKGAEARFVFYIRDLRGRLLFDESGKLTQEGDEIYNRVQRGLPAIWKYPDGRMMGNVRPPAQAPPVEEAPLPKRQLGKKISREQASAQDAASMSKLAALTNTGYVEISESEESHLLKSSGLSESELQKESSLQILPIGGKVHYLMSPSDPLFAVVAKYRSGDTGTGLQGSPTMK